MTTTCGNPVEGKLGWGYRKLSQPAQAPGQTPFDDTRHSGRDTHPLSEPTPPTRACAGDQGWI